MRVLRGGWVLVIACSAAVSADPISIPNASFEAPTVSRNFENPFGALPLIADWDENDVGSGDELNQNTGVFLNTDPGEPDHIANAHQRQLAFLSSLTGNAIRQDLSAVFVPGREYTLTAALATSLTFPVGADEELELALFYFSGGVEQVIASTFISGDQVNANLLIDASLISAAVAASDPWAGRRIGVLIRPSIADPDDEDGEGFWDVDDIRLEVFPPIKTLTDLASLVQCMTGPQAGEPGAACTPAEFDRSDHDTDADVDLLDYADLETLVWRS